MSTKRSFRVFATLAVFMSVSCAEPDNAPEEEWPFPPSPSIKDEPSVPPGVITASEAFGYADPLWSTRGGGFNYGGGTPAVQVPNGLVRLGPDTSNNGAYLTATHTSGYNYDDPHTQGFSHLHFVGTGVEDYGNLRVLPLRDNPLESPKSFTTLDHESEFAEPGYYRVDLPDENVRVELTANTWVGFHRYTALEDGTVYLVWDTTSSISQNSANRFGSVRTERTESGIQGHVEYGGPYTGRSRRFTMHFEVRFGTLPDAVRPWPLGIEEVDNSVTGYPSGYVFEFSNLQKNDQIEFRVGLGPVDAVQATHHLDLVNSVTFDDARLNVRQMWEEKFSKVLVSSDDENDLRKFYSSMFALWRMPTRWQGADGRFVSLDGQEHADPGHAYYTDLSLWDTYRTLHPLYDLIDPELSRDCLRSLVIMTEAGGGMPRWPAATGYTGGMIGASASHLFANAALRDIDGVDYESAYEAMAQAARTYDSSKSGGSQRAGVVSYREKGYVASDEDTHSVARSLEYYWNDFSLSQLARVLGKDEDAADFLAQSNRWTTLWDDQLKFFRPRKSDGTWDEMPKPTDINMGQGAFTEGSAWHYRFFVPFAWNDFIERWGQDDGIIIEEELSEFFDKSASLMGKDPFGGLFPDPFYWHSNEPDIDASLLYFHLGQDSLAVLRTRQIMSGLYQLAPSGVPGNDDGGTLSAWFVFQALGLYPQVGTDRYYAVAPIFRQAVVQLGEGKSPLTILSEIDNSAAEFIGEVELNREQIERTNLRYDQLEGSTLWFNLIRQDNELRRD